MAPFSGNQYANLVASYIVHNFGARGVDVYREVFLGKTIIGKNRRIDILVLERATGIAIAVECKYQDSLGTVDEKIPYTLQDMDAMGMPVCVAYAGTGFSQGILHMLAAAPKAAYCWPDPVTLAPSDSTREVDVALAMTFRWWDLVIRGRAPFAISRPAVVAPEEA
jgi:hypothetical protein